MKKLIDWIADKLGYQRKFTFTPIRFPPLTQELLDDYIQPSDPLEIEILGPLFDARWITDSDAPAPIIKATLTKE